MPQAEVLFLAMLAITFAILLVVLRPAAPSRVTRHRLVTIQQSVLPQVVGVDGRQLEKAAPWGNFAGLDKLIDHFRLANSFKLLIMHANSSMSPGGAVLISVGAGIVCGGLCLVATGSMIGTLISVIPGLAGPYVVLRIQSSQRLKAFNDQLPEAIDLMARSLQAGHSMGSSIELIAEQSPEPLAFEFVQVFQQQRLGLQFRDAMLQMGARVPSRDLQFLITAILIQKETGGDLTEILARTSYVIRERVRIQGEVLTKTAQGRLTGWILSLLPVVMLVLINLLSPGYSNLLLHDPTGQKLLWSGAGLIIVGALIIRKIVDVKV